MLSIPHEILRFAQNDESGYHRRAHQPTDLNFQIRSATMNSLYHAAFRSTRRQFLGRATAALGSFALASLLDPSLARAAPGLPGIISGNPKAKRVIYLFQSGGPPQHDTFDYKP